MSWATFRRPGRSIPPKSPPQSTKASASTRTMSCPARRTDRCRWWITACSRSANCSKPRRAAMSRAVAKTHSMPFSPRTFDFDRRLKEIDMFFEGRGKEHKTMQRLVDNLRKARIPYAIMGGMAVNAHGHERTTKDVDVLLSYEGFMEFRRRYVP